MSDKPIFVTKPSLPPLKDFVPYLEQIWASRILTNSGPFHQQLEKALCEFLGVPYISLFANGTIALVTALQALRITGEVITTPYSFVATAHSLLWNGIKPVFVDIDPRTFNLDPARIEAAITGDTTAIMPVHCYGQPCDVEAIQKIAAKHGLKVVYDAAHAFAVQADGNSILNHGDLSVLSFHATKVFNTFEGGAIICRDAQTKQRIDSLKNFGFVNEISVVEPGTNGKMSEMNAALGLLQLQHVDHAIERRKQIDQLYRHLLANLKSIRCPELLGDFRHNYSYFPILVDRRHPLGRDGLYDWLRENGVHGRRYFYPLLSSFPMYRDLPSSAGINLPVAVRMADEVLCLPIYPGLADGEVARIAQLVAAPVSPRSAAS